MQLHQTLSIALLSLFLFSCGGSLEGDSSTNPTEPTEPATPTEPTDPETPTEPDVPVDPAPAEPGVPSYFTYSGATQSWVAIQGTGGVGRTEASVLTFKLLDKNGDAVSGVDVNFTLIAPYGSALEPLTGITDDSGFVSTTVTAGKVSGSVRVKVQTSDGEIENLSDILSISTGIPDQNSFSLALENHAPEAMNIDGVTVGATVRLADKYNNAVPDGTSIYFTTEGGSIRDAETGTVGSCLTVASKCTLTWESQNPRPEGNMLSDGHACAASTITAYAPCINPSTAPSGQPYNGGMGAPYAGRVTITAFAVGEESFIDNDADGWFTSGDVLLKDLPEVFYDHNEDGVYKEDASATGIGDEQEEFHDFVPIDQAYSPADTKYNGLLCSEDAVNSELCTRDLVNVRANTVLIMASGTQHFRLQQHVAQDVRNSLVVYNALLDLSKIEVDTLTSARDEAKSERDQANTDLASDNTNQELIDALDAAETKLATAEKALVEAEKERDALQLRVDNLNAVSTSPANQDSKTADLTLYNQASFTLYVADIYNNRPPTGSTIEITTNNGRLLGTTSITLADGNGYGPVSLNFTVAQEEEPNKIGSDNLTITVTTPGSDAYAGIVSTYLVTVLDTVPPEED